MARYTPPGSLSSVPAINAELEKISEAFEDTLSRQGDTPNQMEADLDLNGNSLLNVKSDPNNPDSVLSRGEAYDKSETDTLLDAHLSEANTYTDIREAAIRADFLEDAAGPTGGLLTRAQLVASSLNASVGTTLILVDGTSWEATGNTGVPSQDVQANGTLTDASGNTWRLIGGSATFNISVDIPSDFASQQEAVDFYHNKVTFAVGYELQVNYEAGHQPQTGLSVADGDYGYIRLTADDATVTVDGAYSSDRILEVSNARAPSWDMLIDANGVANRGLWYTNGSTGFITPTSGVTRTRERGLYLNNSRVTANECVFTNIGTVVSDFARAAWVTRCSALVCEEAEMSCSGSTAFYVSRNSQVHAASVNASCTGTTVVFAQRGSVFNGQEATYSGGTSATISCTRGGRIIINDSAVNNVQGVGLQAFGAGTSIFADGATLTPATGAQEAISARDGAQISAQPLTINAGFEVGLFADRGGMVDTRVMSITGCTDYGVRVTNSGRVTSTSGSITGSGTEDLRVEGGGYICAKDCETTDGTGSPNVNDTNLTGGFNFADNGNRGFIWV